MKTIKKILVIGSLVMVLTSLITSCAKNPTSESSASNTTTLNAPTSVDAMKPLNPNKENVRFCAPVVEGENANEDKSLEKGQPDQLQSKSKIIKNGELSIRAKDVFAGKTSIDKLLKKYNAYYQNEELNNNDKYINYRLKIRVPSDNFEALMNGIENGQNEVLNKKIEAVDVTEEYIDLESRIANKKEYLKRYRELLSRAGAIKDIIEIQEKVREIQEELESKEGRIKYLKDQINYSTLDITIGDKKDFIPKHDKSSEFSERFKKSLRQGWSSVIKAFLNIVSLWPAIIVLGGLAFGVWVWIKRRRSKE